MTINYSNQPAGKPQAVTWFYVYSGCMGAMYGIIVVAGILFGIFGDSLGPPNPGDPPHWVLGGIYSCFSVPFALAYLLPFVTPRKPWRWVYDLVLICIGLSSPCCMPASIPLLIFYLKDETKLAYGKVLPTSVPGSWPQQ